MGKAALVLLPWKSRQALLAIRQGVIQKAQRGRAVAESVCLIHRAFSQAFQVLVSSLEVCAMDLKRCYLRNVRFGLVYRSVDAVASWAQAFALLRDQWIGRDNFRG